MATRSQEWSARAHARVVARKSSDDIKSYNTACMRMPGLVHQCGLVQALVFMASRSDASPDYVDDLAQVVRGLSGDQLVEQARQGNLQQYLHLTREVVEAATWMRRFAQIELG